MAKIPIILEPGRADGKLVISDAIFDKDKNKFQNKINQEVEERLNDVKDTLNSDSTTTPLSAKQGKVLKELLDTKVIEVGAIPIDSEPIEGNITHIVNSDGLAKEFAKTPYIIDAQNADFDLADKSGNVIMRLKDGHIQVKNFNSRNVLYNENLQIRTELSDDETGNRELRLFIIGYNSEGEPQEYGPYSLPYATERSEGTMSAEDKRHLERLDTTDGEESDLDVSDPDGNVIARFKNGHIQTKKFNSEVDGQTSVVNGEDADLDISDENGNVLARFSGGEFKTKNFDTANTPAQMDDNGTAEFQIADEFGNIIAEFKEGNFRTKNFDSTKSIGESAKVVKDEQDRNILILSRSAVINGKLYL